jgi:hypothetical protein
MKATNVHLSQSYQICDRNSNIPEDYTRIMTTGIVLKSLFLPERHIKFQHQLNDYQKTPKFRQFSLQVKFLRLYLKLAVKRVFMF